jgi:hypothetical protein
MQRYAIIRRIHGIMAELSSNSILKLKIAVDSQE